jgi:hypothetical protein
LAIGTITFTLLFQQRPWDCWVAVYETVDLTEVRTTDLRESLVYPGGEVKPGPWNTYTTVNDAVVAAMLTFR